MRGFYLRSQLGKGTAECRRFAGQHEVPSQILERHLRAAKKGNEPERSTPMSTGSLNTRATERVAPLMFDVGVCFQALFFQPSSSALQCLLASHHLRLRRDGAGINSFLPIPVEERDAILEGVRNSILREQYARLHIWVCNRQETR